MELYLVTGKRKVKQIQGKGQIVPGYLVKEQSALGLG